MPPSKHASAPEPVDQIRLEDAVEGLAAEVGTLSKQVETLRIAIDDLREELQFAIRNLPREPWVPTQPVVSLPRDPLADPFPVNRTCREEVLAENTHASPTQEPPTRPPIAVESPSPAKRKRQKAGELF